MVVSTSTTTEPLLPSSPVVVIGDELLLYGKVCEDFVRLVLPLLLPSTETELVGGGASVATIRYAADRIISHIDCGVEIVLPTVDESDERLIDSWNETLRAAVIISGTKSNSHQVRRLLASTRRAQRHTVHYAALMDSPEALAVARLTVDGGIDESIIVKACPDQEDISGDATTVEYARLKGAQERDQAISSAHVSTIEVPLESAGAIMGRGGRARLSTFLRTGVLLDVAGRISETGGKKCKVFLSAREKSQLDQVKSEINKIIKSHTKPVEMNLTVSERAADWLLTFRRSELESILYCNGTSLSFNNWGLDQGVGEEGRDQEGEDGKAAILSFVGIDRISVMATLKATSQLIYSHHKATLWITSSKAKVIDRIIDRAIQISGAEASTCGTLVQIYGTQSQIRYAISFLQSNGIEIIQIKYQLTQSESVREFVSGKKDGKLIKIMKETGVSLSLHHNTTIPNDQIDSPQHSETLQIIIELVSHSLQALDIALEMLLGEFPAESSFYLADSHHKRLIGHGGKTIQRVMKKHAVYIKFLSLAEAIERDLDASLLPKSLTMRLDNVIIRTPAKNESSLIAARQEIYDMAEEFESHPITRPLRLSRYKLLKLEDKDRSKLADLFKLYADTLDFTSPSPTIYEPFSIDSVIFNICGFQAPLLEFFECLTGPERNLMDSLMSSPPPSSSSLSPPITFSGITTNNSTLSSPIFPPPLSPTSTINSGESSISSHSWTSQNPEFFKNFGMTILQPPIDSTTTLLVNINNTPTLNSIDNHVDENSDGDDDTICIKSPTTVNNFNPAIGSHLRKNSPWVSGHFPKLSLAATTPNSLWHHENVDELIRIGKLLALNIIEGGLLPSFEHRFLPNTITLSLLSPR